MTIKLQPNPTQVIRFLTMPARVKDVLEEGASAAAVCCGCRLVKSEGLQGSGRRHCPSILYCILSHACEQRSGSVKRVQVGFRVGILAMRLPAPLEAMQSDTRRLFVPNEAHAQDCYEATVLCSKGRARPKIYLSQRVAAPPRDHERCQGGMGGFAIELMIYWRRQPSRLISIRARVPNS